MRRSAIWSLLRRIEAFLILVKRKASRFEAIRNTWEGIQIYVVMS